MTIKICALNKTYKKKVVLSNVDLEIPTGSFTVLSGVSGSGKSTLLSIISGIESPTSGKVIIDGQDISRLKGKERADFYRHKIGFVFQGFYLQPQLTIRENIALMGTFAGMPRTERKKRAEKIAQLLGIAEVLDRLPSEVSGGQAERACVARAIFMEPNIILADEPTNNLDEENAKNIIETLKLVQQKTKATVVVATHDAMVKNYATQLVKIKDGQLTVEGL